MGEDIIAADLDKIIFEYIVQCGKMVVGLDKS